VRAPARWEWDETLYAGSAAFYAAGRRPYPAQVPGALRARLGLDGSGRLLDIGCGPGSLTLLLAPLFERAVGVDADQAMIACAGREAARASIGNVSWRHMRAEALPGTLGSFRVVTFAQSFHWTDKPLVAGLVRQMLIPGGACVLVHATTHQGAEGHDCLPHPRPPRHDIAALVASYLGPVRRAGQGALPAGPPDGEDEAMRVAGFQGPARTQVGGGIVWDRTEDEVVASIFSLSSAAPHLFGDRLRPFEDELRGLLRAASPSGRFCERAREIALDLWRP
jgi:SAM-dependent methyltransferase